LKAGAEYALPTISLDLTATSLVAAGADLTKGPLLDGVDLMPYLTGQAKGNPHNRLFWRAGATFAVHEGDWKLWLVDQPAGGSAIFLFDLKADPGEKKNLAKERPEIVQRLREIYQAWNRENAAPRLKGRTSDVEVLGVPVRLILA
jgi:arylsulfatase A-like enzyme